MTDAPADNAPDNWMPPLFDIEPFAVACEPELSAVSAGGDGICFNPACREPVTHPHPAALYCSPACKRYATQEMRKAGHKAANALLVWAMHKRAPRGTPEADLCRAARRYLTQLQRAWLDDRKMRTGIAYDD